MMNFLNLIRYKNLLFIAGLQCLMHYVVIQPILKTFAIESQYCMTDFQFALLVGATVFLAAAGYVINDYFDTKIDAINRPDKVIVGKSISKERASLIHQIFSVIGIVLGLIVAYWCKSLSLAILIVMVPGLLWFYSASYKRQFLTGNIIVAFNAALVPLVIAIADVAFLSQPNNLGEFVFQTPIPKIIYLWVLGFSGFAAISTLIREIIKDMEDVEGDRELESRTVPIVWGINISKLVVYGLIGFTIAALLHVQFRMIDGFALLESAKKSTLSLRYIIFGIIIPFGYLVYLLIKAKNKADYHQASTFMKFILVLGSLYAFVFYFLLCKAQGIALFDLFLVK